MQDNPQYESHKKTQRNPNARSSGIGPPGGGSFRIVGDIHNRIKVVPLRASLYILFLEPVEIGGGRRAERSGNSL